MLNDQTTTKEHNIYKIFMVW